MSHKPIVLMVLGMIQNRGCLILSIKKLPYPCNSYVLIHPHTRIKTPSVYIKPYATSWDQSSPINSAIKHTNYPWPYHHFAGNDRHTLWQNPPFFCQIHIAGPLMFLGLTPKSDGEPSSFPKKFMLTISIFGFIDLMLHLLQIFIPKAHWFWSAPHRSRLSWWHRLPPGQGFQPEQFFFLVISWEKPVSFFCGGNRD